MRITIRVCLLTPDVSCCCCSATTEALGATSDAAYSYINSALHFLAQPAAKDAGAVLEMCMALGQANLGVLKMLSDAHAST
jgi:hypothetical protein